MIENIFIYADDDRGRARYFHGREKELLYFQRQLRRAMKKSSDGNGTIFLIQGSPGAGKTALLYKCSDIAEAGSSEVGGKKWRVVTIDYSELYDPTSLMNRAGRTYKSGKTTEKTGHVEGNVLGMGGGGFEFKTTHQSANADMLEILNKLARKNPLLLVLDEVQDIGKYSSPEERKVLRKTLTWIHNGMLEHPVVLLCGGLGTSSIAFEHLRISRFRKNCVINLGSLSRHAEVAVIRDWLVKDGGAPKANIQPWVTAITRETHGWPQHIMMYAQAGAEVLEAMNGKLTPEGLALVLKEGRAGKRQYYRDRSNFLSERETKALAYAVQNTVDSKGVKKEKILKHLKNKGKMSSKKAAQLFERLLHKGVLSNAGTEFSFYYDIPIPSMKDFLFESVGFKVTPMKQIERTESSNKK